jgi:hypothetical protein
MWFDVLSMHVQIWNTETCWSHIKKGNGVRGKIMEEMNQTKE